MLRYIFKRFLSSIPTFFIIITFSFFFIRMAPGGPFDMERPLDPSVLENLNRIYKLDRPLIEQYWYYMRSLLQGHLGYSFFYRDFNISAILMMGLPVSALVGGIALTIAMILGISLGTAAALRQKQKMDYILMVFSTFGFTVPIFIVAPILQDIFCMRLKILPLSGWHGLTGAHYMVLPIVCLCLPKIAVLARLTRASMLETLQAPHIQTLRAYGMSRRTIVRHAMRSALLPVITYLGPAIAALLTGTIVVEKIFSLPGLGRHFLDSALNRDYTMVMGTVILFGTFIIFMNILVDILHAILDPRVRYE